MSDFLDGAMIAIRLVAWLGGASLVLCSTFLALDWVGDLFRRALLP